ncbi:hypothetical protein B0J11DRAFT_604679, partial [Dendryphion nanum]
YRPRALSQPCAIGRRLVTNGLGAVAPAVRLARARRCSLPDRAAPGDPGGTATLPPIRLPTTAHGRQRPPVAARGLPHAPRPPSPPCPPCPPSPRPRNLGSVTTTWANAPLRSTPHSPPVLLELAAPSLFALFPPSSLILVVGQPYSSPLPTTVSRLTTPSTPLQPSLFPAFLI